MMACMTSKPEGALLAEEIGVTAGAYLGSGEKLSAINVQYFTQECRAVVWAELLESTLDAQLHAVSAFADVRACYADEAELELRFGAPSIENVERAQTAKAVVFSA